MDLSELVDILNRLGVDAKTTKINTNYLNTLEETNHKIQSVLSTIENSGTELSLAEIQVYERYMNSLTLKLFEENALAAFNLISQIENALLEKQGQTEQEVNAEQDNRKICKEICRKIRTELVQNKDLLSTFQQYWILLYRLMKFEDFFKKIV